MNLNKWYLETDRWTTKWEPLKQPDKRESGSPTEGSVHKIGIIASLDLAALIPKFAPVTLLTLCYFLQIKNRRRISLQFLEVPGLVRLY